MSTYNEVKTESVSAANLIRRAVSWSPGSDWALAARMRCGKCWTRQAVTFFDG